MATINGQPCVWGIAGGLGLSGTGIGTFYTQSFDYTKEAEVSTVKDENGEDVTDGWFNQTKQATLVAIVKGTGLANAKTQVKVPAPGTLITVAVTSTEIGESLNSSVWQAASGGKIAELNTDWVKVTIPLIFKANISAVAGA